MHTVRPPRAVACLLALAAALPLLPSAAGAADATLELASSTYVAAPTFADEAFADPWDFDGPQDLLLTSNGPTLGVRNQAIRDGVLRFDIEGAGYVSPLWPGFTGALSVGRDGPNHPIDARRFRRISLRINASERVDAAIVWFRCPEFEDRCLGGHRFTIHEGWRTYDLELANEFPGLPQAWDGSAIGMRLAVNASRAARVEVDSIRLHEDRPGVEVSWVNPAPNPSTRVTLRWARAPDARDADPHAGGVLALGAGASGDAELPAATLPPGPYRVWAEAATGERSPERTLTVLPRPRPVVLDPDEAGGEDYATTHAGGAWDFSGPRGIHELGNVTGVRWNAGRLEASNGGAAANDPYVWLDLPRDVDPVRYHRLTVKMGYAGAFDLADAPGGGAHGRLLWRRRDRGVEFQDSRELVTYPEVTTYTVDLATSPAAAVAEAGPGWLGSPVTALRWDPNEDRGPRRWWIDELALRADDETSGRVFDVRWRDDAHVAGSTVAIHADTDRRGHDGRRLAGGIAQEQGLNVHRVDTRGLAPGRYWLHLEVRSPHATSRTYAGGPLVVREGGAVPRPVADARAVDDVCLDAPPAGFHDVTAGNVHRAAIDCVVSQGLAGGVGSARFDPERAVSRAQMATFIDHLLARAGVTAADRRTDAFTDDDGDTHEAAIDRLAASGIVSGVAPGRFAPGTPVTREQMATFLVRAYERVVDRSAPLAGDHFGDDDASAHQINVDKAASLRVASGTADGIFSAGSSVRRDQLASFLARLLDVLAEDGHLPGG